MRPPGSYKIASRNRAFEAFLGAEARSERRTRKLLDSLRTQILEGSEGLRIRRVFTTPREVFRLELELPELGYQRTTLLDRDALDELLTADDVRAVVRRRLRLG
ncbi:MAG: hypothetical protein DCC71_20125 [Proteobacteria bacterium]|nr:MAG: hypothetical protein DCC71_20125 [Pseudomonadota bacterium]